MSGKMIPQAVHWRTLVVAAVAVGLGVLIGADFAEPIRGAAGWAWRLGSPAEAGADAEQGDGGDGVTLYQSGMHPWIITTEPGNCPICGMKLEPVDPARLTGEIAIDPVVVQNIGVRVEPVVTGPLTRTIRTVGTVDYNERGLRDVNTKVSGWIETLHVDFVGAAVEAGQPLFELYSPQLYAAQQEYLLAHRSRERGAGSADLLTAARTRLAYFDITEAQIAELERSGEPSKTMTIRSPHAGVVIAKHANEGMKIDPGMQVFRIADLSTVWVRVTLYEYQLPYVERGMAAEMSLPYVPGQTFAGEVIFIYPYLDEKTREVQVRLEFENPGNLLKPGMFANVTLQSTLAAEKTLAPRSAVIDTGERQVAFVSLGDGRFEPRDVRLGVESGEVVEIISGLKPGELVVTSGQFLIDSEARMRESLAKMVRGNLASEQAAAAAPAGERAIEALPAAAAAELTAALEQYLAIGEALAGDTTGGVAAPARALAEAIDRLIAQEIPRAPHLWHEHQDAVAAARAAALELADTDDLEAARLRFAELSPAVETLVMATGVPAELDGELHVLHCPMYREGQGGTIWLQSAGAVRNPYFGAQMIGCFDQRRALPWAGDHAHDAEHPAP